MITPDDAALAHTLAKLATQLPEYARFLCDASARLRELAVQNHKLRYEANEAADFLERRAEHYLTLDHQAGKTGALQLGLRVAPLRAAAAERRTT